MRTFQSLALISGYVIGAALSHPAGAQTYVPDAPGGSHAVEALTVRGPNPEHWVFPITQTNESLPSWIQFGGQFRNRWEAAGHMGYRPASDGYDLTQLRLGI